MTEIIRVHDAPGAAEMVGGVIGTAFHDLEVSAWIVPPEDDRRQILPGFFSRHAGHAFACGEIHATADGAAVAVWFHNDGSPLPPAPGLDEWVMTLKDVYADRFATLAEQMDEHHLHLPHHYLAYLAVLPEHQGRGIGSDLLREHHRALDAAGVPAYLEASNARSRELYLRHGYRDVGDPMVLPDGPPMYPMMRMPKRA
ncbi:N-acetyltransferase [Sphaerisporangium album]|uniref:N-acetyltransferase n=1 Tax=Sphaerisporangium album TaxID=509200 RepID=A0A367F4V7_9ACTN|nr:GNAT family N-acetyltransferase [Sphaerisporangium album]RCG25398.1 N-acetyltransferase [Sphaerisporangium album]